MKTTFDITKYLHNKPKHTCRKNKPANSNISKAEGAKDNWGMSPEDALRVSYSNNT